MRSIWSWPKRGGPTRLRPQRPIAVVAFTEEEGEFGKTPAAEKEKRRELHEKAEAKRAEVKAAEASSVAARSAVQISKASYWPTLSLSGSASMSSSSRSRCAGVILARSVTSRPRAQGSAGAGSPWASAVPARAGDHA